jgi:hypothetical protein
MNDLAHNGRSIFKNRVPYLGLRNEAACALPFDIGRFQFAIQLISGKERGDRQKVGCLWINSGRRSEQSSHIPDLGALKTHEKNDENMVH